jgi:hypothetical protein
MNKGHLESYNQFYKSTVTGESLNEREMTLVGLATAFALNCESCAVHYSELCDKYEISKIEVADVLAKVMAVSAGQKKSNFDYFTKNRKECDSTNQSCCDEDS